MIHFTFLFKTNQIKINALYYNKLFGLFKNDVVLIVIIFTY